MLGSSSLLLQGGGPAKRRVLGTPGLLKAIIGLRAELSMGVWRRKRPLHSSWYMFLFAPVSDLVYEVEFNWAHFLEKSLAEPVPNLSRIFAIGELMCLRAEAMVAGTSQTAELR